MTPSVKEALEALRGITLFDLSDVGKLILIRVYLEAQQARVSAQNEQGEPCTGCGKRSSIFTAGCDHCDYEDK